MRVAGILFVLSLGSSLLYGGKSGLNGKTKLEKFVEEHELEPLAESEYWRQHPGVLPYEECKVVAWDGSRVLGHNGEWMLGVTRHKSKKRPFSLFCFSKKLQLAFQVPIDLQKDLSVGFGVSFDIRHITSGHMRNLDGKKVSDLFGTFMGAKAGVGVGVALAGAVLSKNDMWLTLNEIGSLTLLKLSAGFRRVHVVSRPLDEFEYHSPYYLEKLSELLSASNTPARDVENIDEFLSVVYAEKDRLMTLPDSQKYSHTYKFWIHHLKPIERMQQQCALVQQRLAHSQRRIPPVASQCDMDARDIQTQVDPRKLVGTLDPDFMDTLVFKEIK